MNDTTTTTNGATTGETAKSSFVYDESREFFEPADLEKAAARAEDIAKNLPGVKVIHYDGDWPEGAGAALLPLARNEKTKNAAGEEVNQRKTYGIVLWPMFSLEAVRNAQGGESYIRSVLYADQSATILNPLRKQRWEQGEFDVSSCPTTLNDHIEGMRGDKGVIAPYVEAAKILLPKLKDMSPVFAPFTDKFLRSLLQSKPMAMQFNAKLEGNGFFLGLIDKLETITKARGENVEIYQRWRDTRDQEQELNLDNLDLDALKV